MFDFRKPALVSAYAALCTVAVGLLAYDGVSRHEEGTRAHHLALQLRIEPVGKVSIESTSIEHSLTGRDGDSIASLRTSSQTN